MCGQNLARSSRKNMSFHGGSMKSESKNRWESRFFTGGADELSQIKSKERLQRFVRYNRTKKQVVRVVSVLVFLAVCISFVILCLSMFFRIKSVEVTGTSRYTAEDIMAATDIREGMSLYEVTNADVQPLIKKLAYIRTARIKRELPNTLVIALTEDTPVYFAELYGEYFVLSDELRVLERVFEREQLADRSLIELAFPAINAAMVGSFVEFETDSAERYIKDYLHVLQTSDLFEKITAFDLRDRFNIYAICKGIYLVDFGNSDELSTKLTAVNGMLESEVFNDQIPATIDASNPVECPVIKDPSLEIAFRK